MPVFLKALMGCALMTVMVADTCLASQHSIGGRRRRGGAGLFPHTIGVFVLQSGDPGQTVVGVAPRQERLELLPAAKPPLSEKPEVTSGPAGAGAGAACLVPAVVAQPRNLLAELATNVGYSGFLAQATPLGIQELAESILGRSFDAICAEKNTASAPDLTLTLPIHIKPHVDGSKQLDFFYHSIVKGALIFDPEEQRQNDFLFLKEGLFRILATQKTEIELAREMGAPSLVDAQKFILVEKNRLMSAIFHLGVVRGYIQDATAEAKRLETAASLTEADLAQIERLRKSSACLYEVLHALYDYDRASLMNVVGRMTEHWGSQTRYQEILGVNVDHSPFHIDASYLTENPKFFDALKKLFYDPKAPQLTEAKVKKRIVFGASSPEIKPVDAGDTMSDWESVSGASGAGAGTGGGGADAAPSTLKKA